MSLHWKKRVLVDYAREVVKMKKLILPAALAASAGCAAVHEAQQRDAVFLEETVVSQGGQDTCYHTANLAREGSPYAKFLVVDEEGKDTTIFGARGKLDFSRFQGSAELIGFDDTEGSHGIGVNARAGSGGTTFGAALEKMVDSGSTEEMKAAYAGHRQGKIEVVGGMLDVSGDTRGVLSLSFTEGQNLVGAAVQSNDEGEGHATVVAGRFFQTQGEGFGYRAWARFDLKNGDYLLDAILSTRTNIARGSLHSRISPDNGKHERKLFDNRFDDHSYLCEKGDGLIVQLRHSDTQEGVVLLADAIYHFQKQGRIFVPRAILGYTRTDDGTGAVDAGRIGAGCNYNGGYAEVVVEGAEGQKPKVTAVAAATLRF